MGCDLPSIAGTHQTAAPRWRHDLHQKDKRRRTGVAVPLGKLRTFDVSLHSADSTQLCSAACSDGSWRLARQAKACLFGPLLQAPTAISGAS